MRLSREWHHYICFDICHGTTGNRSNQQKRKHGYKTNMTKYASLYLSNFIDKNTTKMGLPELQDSSPYSEMALNKFIQTHYKCVGEPVILQVIGRTMGYRELVVRKEMRDVALNWVKNAEVHMIKDMSARAGQSILHHYEVLEAMRQPMWKPNPLEDTVLATERQHHSESIRKNDTYL
jgi:hypothetical protein